MSPVGASVIVQHNLAKAAASPVDSSPSFVVKPSPYFRWKGVLDRIAALVLLLPGLPMIGFLLLLVRLTSRGPGVYRQVRVGRGRKQFTMYKIRTMRCDAEQGTGPVWTAAKDPRVTLLGRILRKLHLDELPQLFNVLKGEMSLIGPRPERPEFVRVLEEAIPNYSQRLLVLPGVTGLAQINLPPDSDLASVQRKVALDLDYIAQGSLWLDLRLFFCTFGRIVRLPEHFLTTVCGVRRRVASAVEASLVSEEPSQTPPAVATPRRLLAQAAQVDCGDKGRQPCSRNGKAGRRAKRHPK